MTLPRVLSAIGRTMAVLGVVMLLFVTFELWGTGLQQAQAQDNLEGDLAERLRQVAAAGQGAAARPAIGERDAGSLDDPVAPDPAPEPGADDRTRAPEPPDGDADPAGEEPAMPNAGSADEPGAAESTSGSEPAGATPADPATTEGPPDSVALPEYPSLSQIVHHISETATARSTSRLLDPGVEELLPLVYPDAGEAIAHIIIPAIEVDEFVVAGIEVDDLRKGPGHYGTTPLPGQPGNAAIAGHRTTYGAPFGRINELRPGDEIIVETLQGRFVYRVVAGSAVDGRSLGHRIVAPTALEVLDDHGDNRLTLTSCHPRYSSKQRIIVQATLVGDPVVRLPRPDEPIGAEVVQLAAPEEPAGDVDVANPDAARPDNETPDDRDSAEPTDAGAGQEAIDEDDAAAAAETPADDPAAAPDDPGVDVDPATPGDATADSTGRPAQDATTTASSATATATAPAPTPAPATATAPPTPVAEEGFGEGLSGDRDAIVPAMLWGLAAIAVWVLGWAFGRSGRRAWAYAIAAVPFLVVLYVTFSYIDRALPAY